MSLWLREVGLEPTIFGLWGQRLSRLSTPQWYQRWESNSRPLPYEGSALTNWATRAYGGLTPQPQRYKKRNAFPTGFPASGFMVSAASLNLQLVDYEGVGIYLRQAGFEPTSRYYKYHALTIELLEYGDPTGTRTRICSLKGCRPRPVRRWGRMEGEFPLVRVDPLCG